MSIVIPKGTPQYQVEAAFERLADPEKSKREFEAFVKEHLKSRLPIIYGDQMFTWTDPETQIPQHFNSTALYRYWLENPHKGEAVRTPIGITQYEFAIKNRGIERYRVDRLPREALEIPLTIVALRTLNRDWHIIIDGNHRLCRAYELGISILPAVIFPKSTWKKCLITIPENLPMPSWSGIL